MTNQSSEEAFTIHSLNGYAHSGLSSVLSAFAAEPVEAQQYIQKTHLRTVKQLAENGVEYGGLRKVLTPQRDRLEVAFVFDSTMVDTGLYGYEISKIWLKSLRDHGPEQSLVRIGDILALPPDFIWKQMDGLLIHHGHYPRLHHGQYFVVYFTNLSKRQLQNIHDDLYKSGDIYIGYIDCSGWNPLKAGMLLPQFGIRHKHKFILEESYEGDSNEVGYPLNENGYEVVAISDELYVPFLSHRLDNGVPEWANEDSKLALGLLGAQDRVVADMTVSLTTSRLQYLATKHNISIGDARISQLDAESITRIIKSKLANNLIFNLRFVPGVRNGEPVPELDAMMFTVQVELPDDQGANKRYQIALKYDPETHNGEIVTIY